MSAPTRWDPFKEMEDLHNRLSSFFTAKPWRKQNGDQESMTVSEWSPLVDIYEDDKEYQIKVELPEVKKEEVKVTVERGVLTVIGQRRFEKEDNRKYHRLERSYGSFVRTFTLPDDADAEQVHAEFKEGVLTVHLHKNERAKPKQIDVKLL